MKGLMKVSKSDFSVQLNEVLDSFDKDFQEIVDNAAKTVSKESATKLKETSPRNKRTGGSEYADGWKARKNKNGDYVVYNSSQPQLTHLLEFGHVLVSFGKTRGRVAAIPHIAPVERWANKEFELKIRKNTK